jgi:hypothetical protein
MQIKSNEIRDVFVNMGESLISGFRTIPSATNPNYHLIGHADFHKKLEPGDSGYVTCPDKFPEADSIKSLEDWNKLCYSAKLAVFEKKFPVAYSQMPKMYREYREKAVAESKQFYPNTDWYATMMQKYVEKHLPVKIWPKIK